MTQPSSPEAIRALVERANLWSGRLASNATAELIQELVAALESATRAREQAERAALILGDLNQSLAARVDAAYAVLVSKVQP
jgi:hypothetical protein